MISGRVDGLNVVIGGLDGLTVQAKAGAFAGVVEGLRIAEAASRKLISAQDHTLAELAKMGHPYAAARPNPPHTDPVVHVQTGAYLAALTVTKPQGYASAIVEGKVTIEGAMAQLDRWIQDGTLRMIARPWMEWVVRQFGDDIATIIKARIAAALAEAA